jgi:ABC-type nitrate/sulfonate/bicarbonate transport system substrate-binding protein
VANQPESLQDGRIIIKIGFLHLIDCASLVVAQELGYFKELDLKVVLSREVGWASVREKIIYGELHASTAVAGLAHAATYGFGCAPCPCVAPLMIDSNGNAITVSKALYDEGVTDGPSLRAYILRTAASRTLTFAAVHPFSSHNFLLRKWLRTHGINPDKQVRMAIVPPGQMCQNLQAGHLDGFCVGEPWNTLAVENGWGTTVAISSQIDPDHPDKILMMKQSFAEQNPEIVRRLIAAMLKACHFCSQPKNAKLISDLVAAPNYINQPADYIMPSLTGKFKLGNSEQQLPQPFINFFGHYTNEPSHDKERWVLQHMADNGFIPVPPKIIQSNRGVIFRPDLFQNGLNLFRLENRELAQTQT